MAAAPTAGLVGEWKLDETSGTTAVDTKNGYNATVLGGAAFVPGKIGNGLNLNNGSAGTGGKYAEMPSNSTLDNVQEGDYTISAWFYPYTFPPDLTPDNHHWAIVLKPGFHTGLTLQHNLRFAMRHYLAGPSVRNAEATAPASLNTWQHLAGVVNRTAGTVTLYVDGAVAGTASFTPGAAALEYNATPWRIGSAGWQWAADGRVDQVRIYNRALSAAEVGDLFNETQGSGIPFGPSDMYQGYTTAKANSGVFTASEDYTDPTFAWIGRVDSARARGKQLMLRMTDDCHKSCTGSDGADGPYRTNLKFDLAKWKAKMDVYRTGGGNAALAAALQQAVSDGVADGTILGNSVMDEPANGSWLGVPKDPNAVTKSTIDEMCAFVNGIFPTLPCGVVTVHWWRPSERYRYAGTQHTDFILDQYDWWQPPNGPGTGSGSGNVTGWRDAALTQATADGTAIVFAMNILNGGVINTNYPTGGWVCGSNTGGMGTEAPGCRMTDTQVRDYGLALGPYGSGFIMWKYDSTFMASSANQSAFSAVANDLAGRPAKSWRRP